MARPQRRGRGERGVIRSRGSAWTRHGASLPANQAITAQCIPGGDVINPLFELHCAMARPQRIGTATGQFRHRDLARPRNVRPFHAPPVPEFRCPTTCPPAMDTWAPQPATYHRQNVRTPGHPNPRRNTAKMYGRAFGTLLMHSVLGNFSRRGAPPTCQRHVPTISRIAHPHSRQLEWG